VNSEDRAALLNRLRSAEPLEKQIARRNAQIYVLLPLGAALVFSLLATALGDYTPTARVGGAVWIAVLSLIIAMPLVTSRVKKLARQRAIISDEWAGFQRVQWTGYTEGRSPHMLGRGFECLRKLES
jgi:hypothetical protein